MAVQSKLAAGSRVYAIPELLDRIALFLNGRELLPLQQSGQAGFGTASRKLYRRFDWCTLAYEMPESVRLHHFFRSHRSIKTGNTGCITCLGIHTFRIGHPI